MGHRIAVLDHGVLQQVGAPQDVYARPANLFVARFIGSPPMNTVDRARRPGRRARWWREIPGGHIPLDRRARERGRGRGRRRGRDRRAARGPALRRRVDGIPAHGERGRVARPRAPRGVPARRPAARDRAPGRARRRAGRGEHHLPASPTPTRCTCSTPASGNADRRLTRWPPSGVTLTPGAQAAPPARARPRRTCC